MAASISGGSGAGAMEACFSSGLGKRPDMYIGIGTLIIILILLIIFVF